MDTEKTATARRQPGRLDPVPSAGQTGAPNVLKTPNGGATNRGERRNEMARSKQKQPLLGLDNTGGVGGAQVGNQSGAGQADYTSPSTCDDAGSTAAATDADTDAVLVYSFPSRSRCKRCGRINTARTGQDGCVQYRKCTICGWRYKVVGTLA